LKRALSPLAICAVLISGCNYDVEDPINRSGANSEPTPALTTKTVNIRIEYPDEYEAIFVEAEVLMAVGNDIPFGTIELDGEPVADMKLEKEYEFEIAADGERLQLFTGSWLNLNANRRLDEFLGRDPSLSKPIDVSSFNAGDMIFVRCDFDFGQKFADVFDGVPIEEVFDDGRFDCLATEERP